MEAHSPPACSAVSASGGNPDGPAHCTGMRTSRFPLCCLGAGSPLGSATLGLAPCAGCLCVSSRPRRGLRPWGRPVCGGGAGRECLQPCCEQNSAGKCSSCPFFPEHLVLCGLATVSAKGPSCAQPSVPGRGLCLGAKVGRAISPRCPWAQPECSSPHALKAWSPLGILWGHPGKGFVLRQGRGLRASAQPRLTAVGAPGP